MSSFFWYIFGHLQFTGLFDDSHVHLIDSLTPFFSISVISVDDVAKALLSILNKDECNGDIVTVTAKDGIKFKKSQKMPIMTSKV